MIYNAAEHRQALITAPLDQRRARAIRFPASLLKSLLYAGFFVRRCFARVLLITKLVGKESPHWLTLSADREASGLDMSSLDQP